MRHTRRDRALWIAGLSIVTACSWGRWLATGSLKIDESYPHDPAGTFLFVALVIGWGLIVAGWIGFLRRPPQHTRVLAYVGVGITSLMLPMLSNDVFIILAHAWSAARGGHVFTSAEAIQQSPWFAFVGDHWKLAVCKYGPLSLYATMPAAQFDHSPFLARFVLRALWMVPLIATMELSFRTIPAPSFFHTMIWLNPLFLVEGPGQLHLDLLGVTAITAGVLVQREKRIRLGIVFFSLAVLCKWNWILAAPWFVLYAAPTWNERMRRMGWMAACVVVIGAALYVPLWEGTKTLLVPIRAWGDQNPGGSIVDVMGELSHVFRRSGRDFYDPNASIEDLVAMERATRATTWLWASWITRALALACAAPVALRLLRAHDAERGEAPVAIGTGSLIVIVVTFISPVFQSWYLMAALPFFGLACPTAWRRWWMFVIALSVAEAFPLMLPRDAALLPFWVAFSTGGAAIVFVVALRSRFFRAPALD